MAGKRKQLVKKPSRSKKPKAQPSKKRRVEPEQTVEQPIEDPPEQEDPIGIVPLSEQFVDPLRQSPDPPGMPTFKKPKALDYFNDIFRFKHGFYEPAISTDGQNEEFRRKIQKLGWENLLTVEPNPVNLTLVREVLSNAKAKEFHQGPFSIRGKVFYFDRQNIAKYLGLPIYVPDKDDEKHLSDLAAKKNLDVLEMVKRDLCPDSKWIEKDNNPRHSISTVSWDSSLKMIVKFITSRLYPTSHSTIISAENLKLVYAVHHDIPVDAALVMTSKLTSYLEKPSKLMVFPHLITDMATQQKIENRQGDIFILPTTKTLVEKSSKARHGARHELPPPAPGPPKPTQKEFQQAVFESLGSIQGWRVQVQQEMSTQRTILERLASKFSVDTSDLPKFTQGNSEFSPFVQRFIPPYHACERPRGEASRGGAVDGGNGVGGSCSADVGGANGDTNRGEGDRAVGIGGVSTGFDESAVRQHQEMTDALGSDIPMDADEA